MEIGLIGEDPNDTSSIASLLKKKYPDYHFKPLLKNLRGGKLKSDKFASMLGKEKEKITAYEKVIVMVDLDGLESEKTKLTEIEKWYKNVSSAISVPSYFLLNIYELEGLLLADPEKLGEYIGSKVPFKGNPQFKEKPKEYIKEQARKHGKTFSENDCPKIFPLIDFEKVQNKCASFKKFLEEFDPQDKKRKNGNFPFNKQ